MSITNNGSNDNPMIEKKKEDEESEKINSFIFQLLATAFYRQNDNDDEILRKLMQNEYLQLCDVAIP